MHITPVVTIGATRSKLHACQVTPSIARRAARAAWEHRDVRACAVAVVIAATGCQQLLGLRDLPPPAPGDAPVREDARGDALGSDDAPAVTWTVDATSGIATPASATEWSSFLAAKHLAIAPPDGLWLLQEPSGTAYDHIGGASLSPLGNVTYRQSVVGWSRLAIAMQDNSGQQLANTTDVALPDLSTTSMTVLALFAAPAAPQGTNSVLAIGHSATAELDLTNGRELSLDLAGAVTTGTHVYTATVFPIVLVADHTNSIERVHTPFETLAPLYIPLAGSTGAIYLGHANRPAVGGQWLYLAAWYGTHGEFSDGDAASLFTALGF